MLSSRAPLLRWAGSKKLLLPLLCKLLPANYTRYIEPFAGSARLFFTLEPSSSILVDINNELMLFYRILKNNPIGLFETVKKFKRIDYYHIRSLQPAEMQTLTRAARFLFLSRFCFNGIYRTNKQGVFNVPMGNKTGSIPSMADFIRCSKALRKAVLKNCDFEQLAEIVKESDFLYLDPPYLKTDKFTGQYGTNSFALSDISRLIGFLDIIDRTGAKFILSYIDNNNILKTAQERKWRVLKTKVERKVAARTNHRCLACETLIMNY